MIKFILIGFTLRPFFSLLLVVGQIYVVRIIVPLHSMLCRLRDVLFSHAGEVQSLEKRMLQLNTVCYSYNYICNLIPYTMYMLLHSSLKVSNEQHGMSYCHCDQYYYNEQTDCVLCWFKQAMAERSREIEVHKDMLKAQIKASETERRTVRYIPSLC